MSLFLSVIAAMCISPGEESIKDLQLIASPESLQISFVDDYDCPGVQTEYVAGIRDQATGALRYKVIAKPEHVGPQVLDLGRLDYKLVPSFVTFSIQRRGESLPGGWLRFSFFLASQANALND